MMYAYKRAVRAYVLATNGADDPGIFFVSHQGVAVTSQRVHVKNKSGVVLPTGKAFACTTVRKVGIKCTLPPVSPLKSSNTYLLYSCYSDVGFSSGAARRQGGGTKRVRAPS